MYSNITITLTIPILKPFVIFGSKIKM